MAEGKKGIIVYADWLKKFESLEDDEAGRLIKHFFRFVNDLKPKAPDRITELSFIDIEQSLKRDLDKWKVTKDDRSNSGKLGNLKRWNKDLYEKVISQELSIEEAENIAKCRIAIKPIANIAVNDNVNVSESVTKEETPPLKNSNLYRQPIIPTKHEVWEVFKSSGGTQEMAKSFYDKYEVTNWFLNNSPITNWRTLSQRFIGNWQKIEDRKPTYQIQPTAPPLKRVS